MCTDWKVATTLKRLSGDTWGFGTFEAPDYDDLVDHPVEMGTFTLASFDARGVAHTSPSPVGIPAIWSGYAPI